MSVALGSVCRFLNGGTPDKSVARFFEGSNPWITSADITGPVASDARSFISDEAIAKSATNKVPKDAVLLVTRTGVGKVAIAGRDLCISQDITALLPDQSKVATSYLVHFLRTKKEHFISMARGATIKGITRDVVADLSVPLPPLPEQRRIAAILDQADALRAKRREALSHLDSLTQSIFIEMFGDSRTNPKRWPTKGIEAACELIVDCVNRTAPVVEGVTPYKMIRTTNVKSGKVSLDSVRYVDLETFTAWNRRATPRRGDVLLTREAPVGEAGILTSDDRVFLGQRLMLYRPAAERITSEYLLASFRSPFLQDQFEKHGSGSTVKHLPLPACRAFELRMPPLSLQQAFATRIQAVETLKATHLAALAEGDALFDSLQHRAFAGQLS